jgi:DNA-directed RNA polymerase, subunit H (EC 2.7.7.6)
LDIEIFTHRLSPKYRVLSDDEVESLLNKYNVTKRDLPKIKANDPAVTKIGAQEGAIIEIDRNSPTAGQAKYYRFVVK